MKRRHFKQIEAPDRSRVSLVGAWEADYWTHELDVSHGELINIISKVGNSLPAVHRKLGMAAASTSIDASKQIGDVDGRRGVRVD